MTESSSRNLLQEFHHIFYPESIAVVGASRDKRKAGYYWLKAVVDAGYTGNIYPVNPNGGEVLGLKIYPSLRAIPGTVDYAIVCIPREATPSLLDDCPTKKVKAVTFFTAGFKEIGDDVGYKLEEEMVSKAQQGGFRIIGPNCLGVYCPEWKIPCGPGGTIGESGTVGFISQSGGISGQLVELGIARGIKYSKGISFGNGIDLDSIDSLKYMAADPKTSVIGAYLEGVRNGSLLLNTIAEVTKVKPVIAWKAGRTEAGAAAAKSHTGSLASSAAVWSAALKQGGAIEVHSLEELADTLLIFQQLQQWRGKGIAIVCGLADGGGGIAVSASDTCTELGLPIPPLSSSTRQRLTSLLGQAGSILHNPVDVSQAAGSLTTLRQTIELILADSAIDLVLVQEDMGMLLDYFPWEQIEAINDVLMDLRTKQDKPLVSVLPPGPSDAARIQIERRLSQASIPVFTSMERAARAIVNLSRYSHFKAALRS